jgi:fatty-acyl-CoA synthase
VLVDDFPMTVTGKVEVRERSVEILDLGEAAAVRNA